jgi:hypothetical protein
MLVFLCSYNERFVRLGALWSSCIMKNSLTLDVATLAFGLRPRQGGCEVAGLDIDPVVTSHAPGNANTPESVRE